ncbi:uncharacterized protein LOC144572530 [Carex rostrata]
MASDPRQPISLSPIPKSSRPSLSRSLASDPRPSASAPASILRRKIKSEGYNLNPRVKTDLLNALVLAAQRFSTGLSQPSLLQSWTLFLYCPTLVFLTSIYPGAKLEKQVGILLQALPMVALTV